MNIFIKDYLPAIHETITEDKAKYIEQIQHVQLVVKI